MSHGTSSTSRVNSLTNVFKDKRPGLRISKIKSQHLKRGKVADDGTSVGKKVDEDYIPPKTSKKLVKSENTKKNSFVKVRSTNYICVMCGQNFSDFDLLNAHMRSVEPCRVVVAKCPVCDKNFKNKSRLSTHMLVHKEKEKHPCDKCGKIFSNPIAQQAHLETMHTNYFDATVDGFTCKLCHENAPTKPAILHHVNVKHMHVTTFLCDVCGKSFLNETGLKAHTMTHNDTKPFLCQLCSKSFKMSTSLKAHLKTHSQERRFVCEECGKPFKKKCSLVEHKKIHAGDFQYHCNICMKQFVSKSTHNSHMKSHLVDNLL